jgi:hypothetical protein
MSERYVIYNLRDNGGRRSGIERRRFSYEEHIPERRSQADRRISDDRRSGGDRRSGDERRSGRERRIAWAFGERRNGKERHELKILS